MRSSCFSSGEKDPSSGHERVPEKRTPGNYLAPLPLFVARQKFCLWQPVEKSFICLQFLENLERHREQSPEQSAFLIRVASPGPGPLLGSTWTFFQRMSESLSRSQCFRCLRSPRWSTTVLSAYSPPRTICDFPRTSLVLASRLLPPFCAQFFRSLTQKWSVLQFYLVKCRAEFLAGKSV